MEKVSFHIGTSPGQIVIHISRNDGDPIDAKSVNEITLLLNAVFSEALEVTASVKRLVSAIKNVV